MEHIAYVIKLILRKQGSIFEASHFICNKAKVYEKLTHFLGCQAAKRGIVCSNWNGSVTNRKAKSCLDHTFENVFVRLMQIKEEVILYVTTNK